MDQGFYIAGIVNTLKGFDMFSLRSSEGHILSQAVNIEKAVYLLNKTLRGKVSVFKNEVYFCDYYIKD